MKLKSVEVLEKIIFTWKFKSDIVKTKLKRTHSGNLNNCGLRFLFVSVEFFFQNLEKGERDGLNSPVCECDRNIVRRKIQKIENFQNFWNQIRLGQHW